MSRSRPSTRRDVTDAPTDIPEPPRDAEPAEAPASGVDEAAAMEPVASRAGRVIEPATSGADDQVPDAEAPPAATSVPPMVAGRAAATSPRPEPPRRRARRRPPSSRRRRCCGSAVAPAHPPRPWSPAPMRWRLPDAAATLTPCRAVPSSTTRSRRSMPLLVAPMDHPSRHGRSDGRPMQPPPLTPPSATGPTTTPAGRAYRRLRRIFPG